MRFMRVVLLFYTANSWLAVHTLLQRLMDEPEQSAPPSSPPSSPP